MRIIHDLDEINKIHRPLSVALGNFDGVHLGHRRLIEECVEESRKNGWESCVCTFVPHPSQVIAPEKNIKLINAPADKYRLIGQTGIENLILLPFNQELAATTPEDFVKDYLVALLRVKKVYVGFNYSFGLKGRGNPPLLIELSRLYGFEVAVTPPVTVDGEVVSSTLIREKYVRGDITGAARLLGYWPFLEGKVVTGDRRGRELGFPTANVAVDETVLLPRYGGYMALARIKNEAGHEHAASERPAVVNIGVKPTFDSGRMTVEAHLLDFSGDLYGRIIHLQLLRFIRPEQRYKDPNELKKQIEKDISATHEFFRDHAALN